jgi:bacteriocin biosynthesis cyclodehydratase domain-containing protein
MTDEESVAAELRAMIEDPNLRFPTRPVLAPDLDWFEMPDGLGLQIRGTETPVLFRGKYAAAAMLHLLPRLEGSLTVDDLISEAPDQIPKSTIVRAILLLFEKGLLCRVGPPRLEEDEILRRQTCFWGRYVGQFLDAGSGEEAERRLQTCRIVLVATGAFGAATYDLLSRAGCGRIDVMDWDDDGRLLELIRSLPRKPRRTFHLDDTAIEDVAYALANWVHESDLVVVSTVNGPARLFEAVNGICVENRVPWLRGNCAAEKIEVGPYVMPGESGCFTCMKMREASSHEFPIEEHFYQERLASHRRAGSLPPRGESLPFAALAASLVVCEVTRVASGIAPPTLSNAVLSALPVRNEFVTNHFLRVPSCPVCSQAISAC